MWEKIKKILQKEGGKCIIMKEGEPTYIVTQLDNYKEGSENKPLETEKINQNIDEWKENRAAVQSEILPEEGPLDSIAKGMAVSGDEKDQEIKIEDLPF